jgi:hypothetical protein
MRAYEPWCVAYECRTVTQLDAFVGDLTRSARLR